MRKNLLVLLAAVVGVLALASSASAATIDFTNSTTIAVPDNATKSPASSQKVTVPGLLTRLEVRLENVTHPWPADLDVMLESPSGDYFYLMSDQCGSSPVTNFTWNFADNFTNLMGVNLSSCGYSEFKPSDNPADTDVWTTAPGAAPVEGFGSLVGKNPSGVWLLHVADDTAGNTGSINSGWRLRIETTESSAVRIPETGTEGTFGPIAKTVSGFPRAITDVDVRLNDLTHTYPGDLNFALESPQGTKVLFASDGCDSSLVLNKTWIFDDEAPTAYPDDEEITCLTDLQRFRPANHETIESSFGTFLTGGPFGSALSAFDGQFANGNWKLYVIDDDSNDFGYLGGYDLAITTRGAKVQTASNPTFKFKKSGKSKISATGRVTLAGEALTAVECAGSVKSTFQSKKVKKKGKKKVTTYNKVVSTNSKLSVKAGKCGFDISAKLPKKQSGKKLRLVTSYLGGDFIAPFTRTTTEKIKTIKFG